jgi:CHASE3 domain sensor protein
LWLLTVLLLLGAAASAWRMGAQLSQGLAFISRAQQAQQALAVLLRDVVDLESGQRGLLLTGDPAYREQYAQAESTLDAQFQAVDQLLSGDASLHGRLVDVQAALSRKRGEVATSLALYDSKGRDAALDVVRTELGRDAMEEMRANLAGLSASLSGAIAERQNTLGGIVFARNVTLFTALGLAVMASLAGAGLMRRHVLALRAGDEAREEARPLARKAARNPCSWPI